MATTSSLLKSAAATRNKIRQQEDSLAAFEWENSAQTYQDFIDYSKYLQDRSSQSSDPSQQLTYESKLRSARRSYTSNEIQRQSIAALEGRATTQDKMNTIQDLFYQAQDNGDLNLAQNLLQQWDTLSIQQQNEAKAAQKAFSASSAKAKDTFITDLTKGTSDVTLPSGEKVTPLAAIAEHFNQTGDTVGSLKAAQDTVDAVYQALVDKYNNLTTQDEVTKFEEKYGTTAEQIYNSIKFSIGGKTLTAQDITNANANDQFNNPIYGLTAVRNEATGQNEFKLTKNNTSSQDYVRQYNPQTGQEEYVPATIRTDQNKLFFGTSDQGKSLNTQITNKGEVIGGKGQINAGESTVNRDTSQSIGNRLKALGIVATQNGTTLQIKLPGENVSRTATIESGNAIRFYDDQGNLKEISLVDRPGLYSPDVPKDQQVGTRAGDIRTVSPTEVSDFATTSVFGGTLSQASQAGKNYAADITGQTVAPSRVLSGPVNVGNNFTGEGTAALAGNLQGATNILQSAGATRTQILQEQQRQQMIQAQAQQQLQASQTFNLNQTPISQFGANGVRKRQLSVAPPTPQRRVVVVAPPPTPRISSVSVAQPTARISGVSVAPSYGGTLRVR